MVMVIAFSIFLNWNQAGSDEPGKNSPDKIYFEGVKLYRAGKYSLARERFFELLLLYPSSRFAPDSVYKIGESYYRESAYEKGGGFFRLYLERYSLGKNAADAKIRLGACEKIVGGKIDAAHPKTKRRGDPVRAVRIGWFFHPSLPALERSLAQLKLQGANAIIMPSMLLPGQKPHRVLDKGAGPGALFHTTHTDVSQEIFQNIASMAHKYGFRLIAEFPVLSMPTGPRDLKWNPVSQVATPGSNLDIFAPKSLKIALGLIKDLAKNSIDGVLLSDIALPPLAGAGPHGIKAYIKAVGIAPAFSEIFLEPTEAAPGVFNYKIDPGYTEIAKVKCEKVASFVKELAKAGKEENQNLEFYVELSPLSVKEPSEGMIRHSLDGENFIDPVLSGIFIEEDLLAISRAGALTEDSLSGSIERLLRGARAFTGPDNIIFGIKIYDAVTRKTAPDWQTSAAIKTGIKLGVKSFFASPWSLGYDYSKIFIMPFDLSAAIIKENFRE